jgi:uncharacterized repeat protein (TIGR01451 family)
MTVIVSLVAVALLVGSCCGRAPVKKPPSPVWTVEVTPVEDTNPTKTQHTFIATVFDRDGRPLPNVQVHWILARTGDAVGDIVAYDDQDLGVGMARALTRKTDNYYAVSYTNEKPAVLHAGMRWKPDPADRKNFEVLPGQTWCTITSPVEGDSHMIVYVPAIEDARCHKVFAVKHWRPQPALTITKKCPPEVGLGETFEYEITVMNNGDGTAHNVWVMEQFPEGIEVVEGPQFPYNLGDIGPGETAPPIRVSVRAGMRPDIGAGASLSVRTDCPPPSTIGNDVQFNVTVTHNSAEPMQDVTAQARVNGGVRSISSDGQVSGNGVSWNLGMLPAGASVTKTVTGMGVGPEGGYTFEASAGGRVVVSQAMDFLNRVEARDSGGQGEFYARAECLTRGTTTVESPGQAQDSCQWSVQGVPDLRIAKVINPDRIPCGENVEVVVTFWNPGTRVLEGVSVVDTLPEGWTWVSGDQPTWNGTLPMGGSQSTGEVMRFMMKAPNSPRTYTNTATARAGSLSVSASDTVSVYGPQISISKECQAVLKFRNEQGTATITITNSSDATANNVVVTDQIIAGQAILLSATLDGRDLGTSGTYSIGTLGPRETKVINTTFKLTSPGIITNQARVTADCFGGAQDSCSWTVLAPPALQQSIVDRLGGDADEDNFPLGQQFNYLVALENEGDLPLQVKMTVTFPPEIDPIGDKAFVVAGPGASQALQDLTMRSLGGRKYEIMFPNLLKARGAGQQARKAYIMLPAKGNTESTDRAFTVSVSLVWTAFDSTGNTNLGKSGEVIFGETSWIGQR